MMNMYSYMVKPKRKWWVILLYGLYLLPREVGVRIVRKRGRWTIRRVRVNRLYWLRVGEVAAEWADEGDERAYSMIRLMGRADKVYRMPNGSLEWK